MTRQIAGPKITFRAAKGGDVRQLERVVQRAYRGGQATVAWKNEHTQVTGPRTTIEDLEQLLGCPTAHMLVAEMKGDNAFAIAGCVLIEQHAEVCTIGMLSVDPEKQNLGLGRLLVRAAEDYAATKLGCKTAKMCVLCGRDELLSWYKRLGYEPTGDTCPFLSPEAGVVPTDPNAHFIVITKSLA